MFQQQNTARVDNNGYVSKRQEKLSNIWIWDWKLAFCPFKEAEGTSEIYKLFKEMSNKSNNNKSTLNPVTFWTVQCPAVSTHGRLDANALILTRWEANPIYARELWHWGRNVIKRKSSFLSFLIQGFSLSRALSKPVQCSAAAWSCGWKFCFLSPLQTVWVHSWVFKYILKLKRYKDDSSKFWDDVNNGVKGSDYALTSCVSCAELREQLSVAVLLK